MKMKWCIILKEDSMVSKHYRKYLCIVYTDKCIDYIIKPNKYSIRVSLTPPCSTQVFQSLK